ncbi:MAG: ATP-binding protein [Kofleriaceae bacterium]
MLRLLIDSVRDYAIFMLDPGGHVASWNPGAERIKGYTAAEIVGRHFSTFYPAVDVTAGKCELELEIAKRDGRVEDVGWRLRKDGTRFWANVVISAIRDRDGQLLGFSKVTRDLTEVMRAEEDRQARLVAEDANRAKDDFLAMLGHELRNPLAPIVTALQLMKLRGDQRSSKEQDVIERQVRHMIHLVDDLLDVSRISCGKIELKKRLIDVRSAITKAIETASPLLEKRRHHFDTDIPNCELTVDADEARLTQVFTNLLTNAAKYTEPEGRIRLCVTRVSNDVVIEVIDNGSGIDLELLPRVFDLFVQGYQTTARSQGGLGLGLTLVRSLVNMHNGQVTASSAGPRMGSTFAVRLPLAATPASSVSDEPSAPLLAGTKTPRRILLVDDNVDALLLLADILMAAGHRVETAPDAVAALNLLKRFQPEVAILDIGLPVMDGYELAERIRGEMSSAPPVLIALTGYGQGNDRDRSRSAGFSLHLVKPVDVTLLVRSISDLER